MSNNATAEQKRRWNKVVELGCLACRLEDVFGTPCEIHHCKEHGYKNHNKVCGLCPIHHRSKVNGILNRHADPKEFAEKYGTDEELHRKTQELLGEV